MVNVAQTQKLRHWANCNLAIGSALKALLLGGLADEVSLASYQLTLWKDETLTCPVLTSTRSSTKTANPCLHLSFASVLQFDVAVQRGSVHTGQPHQHDAAPLHYFVPHCLRKDAPITCLPSGAQCSAPGSGHSTLSKQAAA